MNILIFDIETIPQQTPLSDLQEETLQRKLDKFTIKDNEDLIGIRNRIMATSPYFGEIVCIGAMKVYGDESGSISLVGTEKEILTRWWEIIKKHKGVFVHYNGLGFDVPFILKRSMFHGIEPTHKQFADTKRFQRYPHFDVQQILADWDRYQTASLELACEFLGVKSPKDGEIKAANVAEAFAAGRIDEIAEYCLKDVQATYDVYQILQNYTYIPKRY
ncbi:hypothetical protein HN682_05440 [Candidatus Peregrinibacteria bacterium]|jgi:predicted PolB exonuclease-like 3'-5' exonuclease|nr:hypothetical protein [Candidatus Peregrinibacteria bacterium]